MKNIEYDRSTIDTLDLDEHLADRAKQGWVLASSFTTSGNIKLIFVREIANPCANREYLKKWMEENTEARPFTPEIMKDGNHNYIHRTKVAQLLFKLGVTTRRIL